MAAVPLDLLFPFPKSSPEILRQINTTNCSTTFLHQNHKQVSAPRYLRSLPRSSAQLQQAVRPLAIDKILADNRVLRSKLKDQNEHLENPSKSSDQQSSVRRSLSKSTFLIFGWSGGVLGGFFTGTEIRWEVSDEPRTGDLRPKIFPSDDSSYSRAKILHRARYLLHLSLWLFVNRYCSLVSLAWTVSKKFIRFKVIIRKI